MAGWERVVAVALRGSGEEKSDGKQKECEVRGAERDVRGEDQEGENKREKLDTSIKRSYKM